MNDHNRIQGQAIQGLEKIQGLALKKLPLRPDLGFFPDLVLLVLEYMKQFHERVK
ncbi:MAG: hypothetical protein Q7S52_00875 [bacterium]|nr:hypothetical protein [bacterium]